MIDDLRPYSAYKTSGLPWLGDMPQTWEVRRNGRLFLQRNQTGFPDLPILEVSLRTGVRVRNFEASARKQVMSDRDKYKRACKGDIAYNMMRMWQGAVGVPPVDGLVSPAYVVAQALPGTNTQYFEQVFRTDAYMEEANKFSRGIVSDRNRLYWEDFKQMPTPCPPAEEQAAIVRFLDHADRRIRRYIAAKQKLIRLLNEQKQVIIHYAVSRGFNLKAHYKPSGVKWLGNVPEHWAVAHLRYVVRCLDGKRIPLNAVERGRMLGEYPYWGANRVIDYVNDWLFDEPLVLLGEDGAPFFEKGRDVAFSVNGKIWVNNHAHVLRCKMGIDPDFLARVLNCVDYVDFVDGSTRDKLTQQSMGDIPIQIPPRAEQRAIVERLSKTTASLSCVIDRANKELELIREYRTRLVADVVMGKLDVRDAAAALPNEASAPGSVEDLQEMGEGEELLADSELDPEALTEAA